MGAEQHAHNDLVHPFDWFQTITMNDVNQIRLNRIQSIKNWMSDKQQNKKSVRVTFSGSTNVFTDNHISKVLHHYQWNIKLAMDMLEKDYETVLNNVLGINTSNHLKSLSITIEDASSTLEEKQETDEKKPKAIPKKEEEEEILVDCLICCEEYSINDKDWIILPCCNNGFCRSCLSSYLDQCYQDRINGIQSIACPHHDCPSLLNANVIHDIIFSKEEEQQDNNNTDLYDKLVKVENEV